MGSNDIFIGIERFGSLMARRNIGTLSAQHYQKGRFFDIQQGDTHYSDLSEFHAFRPYYPTAQNDYDNARLIGDKIPKLYTDFDQFGKRFPNAKVIFIVRNVLDVCQSYQRRKENPSDNWRLDYEHAVTDWNQSIQCYRNSASSEFTGMVVEYEKLFNPDDKADGETAIQQIVDHLEISDPENLIQTHTTLMEKAGLRSKRSVDILNSSAKQHILLNADIDGYRNLLDGC